MPFSNQGASATTPANPDYRFALHTRQGVENLTGIGTELTKQMNYKLGSEAVQVAGKVATDVYTGLTLADTEKQLYDEAINPFMDAYHNGRVTPENAASVAESRQVLAGLTGQREAILKQGDENGPYPHADLQANEAGFVKETAKLKASLLQGRMSQNEFEMRIRSVARGALNRNPGLSQQILQHTQLVEHMSGVRQMVDPGNDLAKAQAAKDKQETDLFIKQANSVNYKLDVTQIHNPNYRAAVDPDIAQKYQDRDNYEETLRSQKAGEIISDITAQQKQELVPSVMRGAYQKAMNVFAQHAGEAVTSNAGAKTDAITNMNAYIPTAIYDFEESLVYHKIDATTRKYYIDRLKDDLDRSVKNIESDVSGKRLADVLGNTENALHQAQKINVLRNHDVAALDLLAKIGPLKEWENFQRNNPAMAKITQDQFTSLMLGMQDRNSLDSLYKRELNPSTSNAAWLTSQALKSGNNEAAGKIIDTAKQLTVDFADKNFGGDVGAKVAAQGDIIREIGKLKDVEGIDLSTEDRASFRALTGDYLRYAGAQFNRDVSKLESQYGVDVYTRFDKDGRMIIEQSAAPGRQVIAPHGEIAKLNAKYATAFNDSVQAMAAIHRDSWASSSQTIVNNYAQEWQFKDPGNPLIDIVNQKKTVAPTGARGQNENNPLNLKIPGENKFQSFQNKSEGIKASYSQLLKYHDGSSANTDRPLESPLEMLRLWNNQAEKGSATDKQYAANVAKYSGLDVSKPIDRNDKDSWVDLLYGMAVAEGSKGVTRKEIRLALKE